MSTTMAADIKIVAAINSDFAQIVDWIAEECGWDLNAFDHELWTRTFGNDCCIVYQEIGPYRQAG